MKLIYLFIRDFKHCLKLYLDAHYKEDISKFVEEYANFNINLSYVILDNDDFPDYYKIHIIDNTISKFLNGTFVKFNITVPQCHYNIVFYSNDKMDNFVLIENIIDKGPTKYSYENSKIPYQDLVHHICYIISEIINNALK